jgi:hypothetical protein
MSMFPNFEDSHVYQKLRASRYYTLDRTVLFTAVLAQALLSILQDKYGNLLWIDYATYEGTIRFPLLDIFMQVDDRLHDKDAAKDE